MKQLSTPISEEDVRNLKVGDRIELSGYIYTGRDAVLPRIVNLGYKNELEENNINLKGSVIFHTAVSVAGVGPTSSNKVEIECSMVPLSELGVKLHLGKGAISQSTIQGLADNNSVYAIIPPVSALLGSLTIERDIIAFPEEGMEAFHRLKVQKYTAIIAAAHGESIYKLGGENDK